MLQSSARAALLHNTLGRRAASSLALKYSKAAFNAALKKSPQTLSKVQTELNLISSTLKEIPDFKQFISNPTLTAADRQKGLDTLLKRAEGAKKEPVSDVTKNLFTVLSENNRLTEAEGVIEGFSELLAAHNGELTVTITSAAPLPKDIQLRLESVLKQSQTAKQAKVLKIANKINPHILGGILVDFGEKSVDLSVASRVSKLNSLLQLSV